jgi:hypothetical protein
VVDQDRSLPKGSAVSAQGLSAPALTPSTPDRPTWTCAVGPGQLAQEPAGCRIRRGNRPPRTGLHSQWLLLATIVRRRVGSLDRAATTRVRPRRASLHMHPTVDVVIPHAAAPVRGTAEIGIAGHRLTRRGFSTRRHGARPALALLGAAVHATRQGELPRGRVVSAARGQQHHGSAPTQDASASCRRSVVRGCCQRSIRSQVNRGSTSRQGTHKSLGGRPLCRRTR